MPNFSHLKNPKNLGSGVAQQLLVAPVAWFAAGGIKEPPAVGTAPGDEVIINLSHQFLSTKGFFEILLAPETNSIEARSIGDKGFQKFDQVLKVFVPGSYSQVHECVKNLLNTPFIALIRDSNCESDLWYQLGSDCVPAYFTCDFNTGTTREGKKGYEVQLSYSHKCILLYAGDIRKIDSPLLQIFLGVDGLGAQLDYLIGMDENDILGFDS